MNLIIVESKNDKAFVLAIVNHLNISSIEIDNPIIIDEDDCVLLNGLDSNPFKPNLLARKIKDIKTDLIKKGIQNIGIIIDLDNDTVENKILYINNAIKKAFESERCDFEEIKKTNTKYKLNFHDEIFFFICQFTNYKGKGELETILKRIATKNSTFADCLDNWRNCIEKNGKQISGKEFDKFWISNYIRFDTCTEEERKQAGRKCSMIAFDYIMKNKPEIFNLDSDELKEIRSFLNLFK